LIFIIRTLSNAFFVVGIPCVMNFNILNNDRAFKGYELNLKILERPSLKCFPFAGIRIPYNIKPVKIKRFTIP